MCICTEEADETIYWVELIKHRLLIKNELLDRFLIVMKQVFKILNKSKFATYYNIKNEL